MTLSNKSNDLHYPITKAVFYVEQMVSGMYSVKGPFKVFFNPSQISISADRFEEDEVSEHKEEKRKVICYAKPGKNIDESNESCTGINTANKGKLIEWVSMELMFDLVESYELLKADKNNIFFNRKFTGDKIDVGLTEISVLNSSCCSLPKIIDAFENSYRVMFAWGEHMEYKGLISSMDVELQYFSAEGSPLRANTSLTLKAEDCGDIFDNVKML